MYHNKKDTRYTHARHREKNNQREGFVQENNVGQNNPTIDRERKKRVLINDHIFEQIKHLLSLNRNVLDIIQLCNISRDAAYRAVAKIQSSDGNVSFSNAYGRLGVPKNDNRAVNRLITETLGEDNLLTQISLKEKLREAGRLISSSYISRLVKDCSLTRKKLKKRCSVVNTEDHFERWREYAFAFSRLERRNILFLDKSGFILYTSINYGYSPLGISPITELFRNIK
ncbi:hypothetical protein CDIK_2669 [Cucumispora dikerogammari]|nr:hypothetical protein CDIK_2669 [Cucumispora dikerogammari]